MVSRRSPVRLYYWFVTNADRAPLDLAYQHAVKYLTSLPDRPVGATAGLDKLVTLLGGAMPAGPVSAVETIELLDQVVDEGGVPAASGPRYFGYVTCATLPVAVA